MIKASRSVLKRSLALMLLGVVLLLALTDLFSYAERTGDWRFLLGWLASAVTLVAILVPVTRSPTVNRRWVEWRLRRHPQPGKRLTHTLAEVRMELVGPVLAAARVDPNLDALLEETARAIAACLREAKGWEQRRYRQVLVCGYLNGVINQATEPGRPRESYPYGQFSRTAIEMAGACRLIDNRRLLHA